ncbi:MAG: hypothetical protein PHG41_04625 [Actinomycetota bacterium]|nr:hypothetical protein [Actinomycetota bacterium]
MKTKVIIFSIIMTIVFMSLATGCTGGPVEITDVVMCKDLDSNYGPVDPTTVFPLGTDVINASVKVNNMSTEDKITVKWNYLETGNELNTAEFTTEEPGSGYVGFSLTIEGNFPAGRYNAVVYLNGEEVKTVEFSVE